MPGDALLQTPLHSWHKARGARLVEFGGWSMPVQYTSIVEEHQAVRQRAGLFDIGHMGRLRFEGPDALAWLEHATTNHVAKLVEDQIQYSLMVADDGGILDDVLVYRTSAGYAMVCNASNRPKVVARLEALREPFDARLVDETLDTAMIAVQGPEALSLAEAVLDTPLDGVRYYHSRTGRVAGGPALASRTGYTGEDGFELIVPAGAAESTWEALFEAGRDRGVTPCGLGARDTLRFEAAMPLYGHEMDETVDPFSAGLGWAVKLGKGEFAGRSALVALKADPKRARIGLRLEGKRIARQGSTVLSADGNPIGVVTSGTFAPTLGQSLAMALVDRTAGVGPGAALAVDVRGHAEPATVVPLPFYRRPVGSAGPSVG